ncbi:MAG: dienelactone hydrolase family protein [Bacteroidetes bacterium]|nr:dienelactone hydrolase family protein [Bacteroidota bacterium]
MKTYSILAAGILALASCSPSPKTEEAATPTGPALLEREITYMADSVEMKGFLVYDTLLAGDRPGVLVVHEWWGHNEHARNAARKLAAAGYTAFAVDMFGDGATANHPEQASAFTAAVMGDPQGAVARFGAALETLLNEGPVKTDDVAAIGYCFGGGVVLNMARQGMPLDATVSFHGSLGAVEPARPGMVKGRMLVLNGEADPFVPAESIAAFKTEMDAAGVNYTFINYPGAVHAFTNPEATSYGEKFSLPLAYNAAADSLSWAEALRFLEGSFGK